MTTALPDARKICCSVLASESDRSRPAVSSSSIATSLSPECPRTTLRRLSGARERRVSPFGLRPIAPSALDQRVVEDRPVVVLVSYDDDLVPGARIHDPLVVDLRSKTIRVWRRQGITGVIHAPPAIAAANDRDEFPALLVVVGRGELDQWVLGRSAAQERDDVLSVASPPVLADRLAKSDVDRALPARRPHVHAVGRVAIAPVRPSVRLAVALLDQAPFLGEVGVVRADAGAQRLDDRAVEARPRELGQQRAQVAIRNVLHGDGEWAHAVSPRDNVEIRSDV